MNPFYVTSLVRAICDPLLLYYPVQRCPMHVTLKPADTLVYVKPGDRGEGVGVVGLSSNNLTVLI